MLYPLREIERLDRRMNRLIQDIWGSESETPQLTGASTSLPAAATGWRMPAVDIQEKDKKIVVTAEIPGATKDDIQINISENRLEIKAETREEKSEEKEGYVYKERRHGSFYRSLELPTNVKADKAKASYKDGLLKLDLPKSKETKKTTIKIE
ncbi:MAG TPA: Hsp20/alpha crystallin family protein [Euryarchaeota archaeon]|nr:spore protein SP21 [archaeon BMS3Bbin16]HDH27862.1 Hsp20/alpha crystallin family protein [Euryarchaeota archaeon]